MKKIYRCIPVSIRERTAFLVRAGYFPQFKNPVTYNHKVNYRKLNWRNPLFVTCSDKIAVKKYVSEKIGGQYVLDNLLVAEKAWPGEIRRLLDSYGAVVVKANHNSGPVQLIEPDDDDERIEEACKSINKQLAENYGKVKQESWYSEICPQVLVEKRLRMADGSDPCDYKFHVFNSREGNSQTVILQMDHDRHSLLHRSFFNESLEWLPFSWKHPCLKTHIERPAGYEKMVEIAKLLALPFSHARVDLYNIDGRIVFGEITFAHASGRGRFSSIIYDKWLGKLWELDPAM